jgi:uncharacterized small protein (DUF1192 family)
MSNPISSKEKLAEALQFVEVLRDHDLTKYAKHPRQDYILALADEIERLQAELQQSQDIRSDRETHIELVRQSLGVETEPHQTFWERLLEAAEHAPQEIERLKRSLARYEQGNSLHTGNEPETVPVPDKAEGTDVCRWCYFTPDKCICTPPPPGAAFRFTVGDAVMLGGYPAKVIGIIERYRVQFDGRDGWVAVDGDGLESTPTKCAGDANG